MPNVTNTKIVSLNPKHCVIYFTLFSDGSQETGTVVYDSSAIATAMNKPDPLTCTINSIKYVSNSAAGVVHLNFHATASRLAMTLPNGDAMDMCFEKFGGLKNYAATGRTGDITITTTGLASGDSITLILDARPD